MRKSIDGLMAIVQEELREDAYSGHLFVFVSRRCDRVKILTFDKGGFVCLGRLVESAALMSAHLTGDADTDNFHQLHSFARARAG